MSESPEPSSVLGQVIAGATREAERINAEIANLQAQIDQYKAELKPYERVIKAAQPRVKPGPKPAGGKAKVNVSAETSAKVLAFLREHFPDGAEFTQTSVVREAKANGLGLSESTLHYAVAGFREAGDVRLVRRGTGGSAILTLAG